MRREASPAPPRRATAASRRPTAAPCSSTSSAPCRCPRRTGCCAPTEYGEITRIGASKPITVDVRIVAATNENLPAQVDEGKFRADLLDRLSFEVITLPPLRARAGRYPAACRAFRPAHGGRARLAQLAGLQRARWPRSKPITGPATCASCAMSSSARSIATRIRSGRSTRSSSILSTRPGRRRWRRRRRYASTLAISRCRAESQTPGAAAPVHRRRRPAISAPRSPPTSGSCSRTRSTRNRFNQRATAAALGLSYDQLRHALKRHKLPGQRCLTCDAPSARWSSPAASGSTAGR